MISRDDDFFIVIVLIFVISRTEFERLLSAYALAAEPAFGTFQK